MEMKGFGGIAFIGDLAPGYYLTIVCAVSLVALNQKNFRSLVGAPMSDNSAEGGTCDN
jgi:hypothetical protein